MARKRLNAGTIADPHVSIEELRSKLWEELDEEFPGVGGEYKSWASLIEVYPLSTAGGYCIARVHIPDGETSVCRLDYTVDSDENVEILGKPLPIDSRYVQKGTLNVVASRARLLAGDDASTFIADLKAKNPLFASLDASPSAHLIVMDYTTVGAPSQHAGRIKYQLATAGLEKAMATLIAKPIHVTPKYDGHFVAGKEPKVIGTFLGADRIQNDDGTVTVRAIGTLWPQDFPGDIEAIVEKRQELGASYEINYSAEKASRLNASTVEISEYEFSGGAILKKIAAAHPETQLLIASADVVFDVTNDRHAERLFSALPTGSMASQAERELYQQSARPDSDFALIQVVAGKRVRRFPIHDAKHREASASAWQGAARMEGIKASDVIDRVYSRAMASGDGWVKSYRQVNGKWLKQTAQQGGRAMKFPGIPEEHEGSVELILASSTSSAVTAAKLELTTEHEKVVAGLKAQIEASSKQLEAAAGLLDFEGAKKDGELGERVVANITTLKTKLAGAGTELEAAKTTLGEKTEALTKIEASKAIDAEWTKLVADYRLPDTPAVKEKLLPLVTKLASSGALTKEEWKTLQAEAGKGAPVQTGPRAASRLFAAGSEEAVDPKDVTPVDKETLKREFPALAGIRYR
jgi:hypothetical protein